MLEDSEMSTLNRRVVSKFNEVLGSDIKNLHRAKQLADYWKQEFTETEAKLIPRTKSESKSTIQQVFKSTDAKSTEVEKTIKSIKKYDNKVKKHLQQYDAILENVSESIEKIKHLDSSIEYFKILQDIQDVNNCLKSNINGKDEQKLVGLYLSLYGEAHSSNSISGRLEGTAAENLRSYALQLAVYWYDVLVAKLSKEFEALLKSIRWPNMNSSLEVYNPPLDALNRLSLIAEQLFVLKRPGDLANEMVFITPSITVPRLSTTTTLLLKPFRQRFLYHFTGNRQTNRMDKPEWFYTQILTWAKDNHTFVGQNFQSAVNNAGHEDLNIRIEFVRGIVQLTIEKLCEDIEEINRDEHLFAHLLDETLAFEQELHEHLYYPNYFPSAISVLVQPQFLVKWLSIEEKFCTDKMDMMFQSDSPWDFLDPVKMDDYKIPKCADQFVRLLDAIRERYCNLGQPGHKLQFLNLQIDLIEDFRRRLVQLHNSQDDIMRVKTTQILNTVNYVTSVLREWGESVHYLHLHAALIGPNADEIDSVFDESIEQLEHWMHSLIADLSQKSVDDIKARSMAYRHDQWVSMHELNSREPYILSATAAEMFQLMVNILHSFEKELSENLFHIVLRKISGQLDDFFIDSMIMNTRFSTGGASQFNFDIMRNLLPLFGQYVKRPVSLFKKVHDACILLILPAGNALLLNDTLKRNFNMEDSISSLEEIGVRNLHPSIAVDIIQRRTDIKTY